MKRSYLKISWIFVLVCATAGCAPTGYNYPPTPDYNQPVQNRHGLNQSDVTDTDPNTEIVMRKTESEGLQMALLIAPEVARLVGYELFDVFMHRGWTRVGKNDASNNTKVDVLCQLGADNERVAVKCNSISVPVNIDPARGSISVNQETIRNYGPNRIRASVADMVEEKYVEAVNSAVAYLNSLHRR